MEKINEIIIKEGEVVAPKKLTPQQKYYLKKKLDPDYIERQRLSSRTHYNKHKEVVQEKIRKYQRTKLELTMAERLFELQQEHRLDLHTGDIDDEEYKKLTEKLQNKLAHLHLVS
jgi:hypothetical protein